MGCISSKAIARSMSIREEFNHGFQSKAVAWEELLTSDHGGNDHQLLIAFLSSANSTTTNKRRTSSSFSNLPTSDLETALETKYFATSSTQDLIPQSEVNSNADDFGDVNFSRFTRSKSCHTLRENEIICSSNENNTGSRSFHTVEEYDALLERIHSNRESFEDYLSSIDAKLQQSKSFNEDKNDNSTIQRIDSLNKKADTKEDLEDLTHENSSSSMRNLGNIEKETGWKRKAVAKELKSLDVSNIEFPIITRQRQFIQMEGSYITPKFGSYNSKVTASTREEEQEDWGNSVFCTELVAAFEDCMQQLQLEEESILSHIDGDQTNEESS